MHTHKRDLLAVALFTAMLLATFALHVCIKSQSLDLKARYLLYMFIGGVLCHLWVKFVHWAIRREEEERPLLLLHKKALYSSIPTLL
jgi:hypothetical protein